MSVLPTLARRERRLLRGYYSSVIAPTNSFANPVWLFFPSALASCKKSLQVATSSDRTPEAFRAKIEGLRDRLQEDGTAVAGRCSSLG